MTLRVFFHEHPPKSGMVKKLWDWFIKETGHEPFSIVINHPGYWQRSQGTPNYCITSGITDYCIWDVKYVVENCHIDNSEGNMSRNYYFDEQSSKLEAK